MIRWLGRRGKARSAVKLAEPRSMLATRRDPATTPIAAQIDDVRAELLNFMAVKPARFGQLDAGATPETQSDSELTTRLAVAEAELAGLKQLLAEVRDRLAETRQDRDSWRERAEKAIVLPKPDQLERRRPWWRRLVG